MLLSVHLALIVTLESFLDQTLSQLLLEALMSISILVLFRWLHLVLLLVLVIIKRIIPMLHFCLSWQRCSSLWRSYVTILCLVLSDVHWHLLLRHLLKFFLRERELRISSDLVELLIVGQEYWIVEPEVIGKLHRILNLLDILVEVVSHGPDADGTAAGSKG